MIRACVVTLMRDWRFEKQLFTERRLTAKDAAQTPKAPCSAATKQMADCAPVFAARYRLRLADGSAEVGGTPEQSVLAAFERRGGATAVPVGCRNGGCGVCRVRVLDGRVRAEKMSLRHVNAAERAAGYALACRIYPLSDLIVAAAPRNPCNTVKTAQQSEAN
jgi:ferredoxin